MTRSNLVVRLNSTHIYEFPLAFKGNIGLTRLLNLRDTRFENLIDLDFDLSKVAKGGIL